MKEPAAIEDDGQPGNPVPGKGKEKKSGNNQVSFQRFVLFELGDAHDAETNDATLRVHTLHHGIVLGFLLLTGGVGKSDFKEIRLGIEPNFYFIRVGFHQDSSARATRTMFGRTLLPKIRRRRAE